MESKYEKMIEGAAADIVFDLQSSALTCAWTSSPIPVMYWEQEVSAAFKEVFEDILADKAAGNPGEITERLKSISKPLTEPIINLFSKIKNGSGKFMREVGLRVQ